MIIEKTLNYSELNIPKHILVPIDFSNDSIHALEYAIVVANNLNFDIRLIHVKRKNADYDSSFNLKDFDEVLKSGIIEKFEQVINKYLKIFKGTFDYKIREGRIYNEICNQAKYGDSEFIIMGTHGVSGFEERWMGSNAFRVVSHSECPVLSTRYDFALRPIKHIVLPIDITDETRFKVPFVAKLAQTFNAKVSVIDIRETDKVVIKKKLESSVNQVLSYLKRKKVICIHDSLKGANSTNKVIEYALLNDVDLITIMNDKSSKSTNFLMGQYAQQMVNHSPIPVLSFKPEV